MRLYRKTFKAFHKPATCIDSEFNPKSIKRALTDLAKRNALRHEAGTEDRSIFLVCVK